MQLLYLLFIGVVLLLFLYYRTADAEGFSDVTKDPVYQAQMKDLNDTYGPGATGKRPVDVQDMEEDEQNLVNFYMLGCRYPGYIGPMMKGHMDADLGIQAAVNAGCRVFVMDIDYLDKCAPASYYPRLVVRDIQGKLVMHPDTNQPLCQSPDHSNLKDLFAKINFYAFSSGQSSDPLVIVLYFHRQPPGAYNSKLVLDYYSAVAQALAPFQDRMLRNELDGGTFYRQKQEGRLLINKISDYSGKVLVFSNANTTGFRETTAYDTTADLDYMTHLRLSYTQTQMGVTENGSGSVFGILQAAEDFTAIPNDRMAEVSEQTKLRWTICLSRDPSVIVPSDMYDKVTKMGVHCVPTILFDPAATYLFTDTTFKKHGIIPKPVPLRYIKPPVIIPAAPNPSMDAKGGMLRTPVVPTA